MNSARSAHPRILLARHRPLLMRSVLTVIVATLALTLSACQDNQTQTAGGTTPSSSPGEATSSAPATATPKPTTSVDATALIGRTTITGDQAAMCGLDDATTQPTADSADSLSTDSADSLSTGDSSSDSSGDATPEPAAGTTPATSWLMAGGLLIERCGDDELIGLSALSGEQVWTYSSLVGDGETDSSGDIDDDTPIDTVSDSVSVGTRHIFVVRTTQKPASGLNDTSFSRELVALNALTGARAWTAPLESTLDPSAIARNPDPELTVVESGGASTGLTPTVAIRASAWSGFNADTGAPLWTVSDDFQKINSAEDGFSDATYVGDGVVLTHSYGSSKLIHGVDAKTGKVVFKAELPADNVDGDWQLSGKTIYQLNEHGVNTIDLVTGRTGVAYRFPLEWLSTVADNQYAAALKGDALIFCRISDVQHPIWTQAKVGSNVRPVAVSADTVIVEAQSGVQILDARTGEVRTDVPALGGSIGNLTIVDGLAQLTDGSFFEMSPPRGSAQ